MVLGDLGVADGRDVEQQVRSLGGTMTITTTSYQDRPASFAMVVSFATTLRCKGKLSNFTATDLTKSPILEERHRGQARRGT